MGNMKYINVSLEVFGGALSLFIILSMILSEYEKTPQNRKFIRMIACNFIVLITDAAAWLFKGNLDWFSHYAVRISNYLSFVSAYLLLGFFTSYLMCYIESKVKISQAPAKFVWGMCVVAIMLVTISQFNHMYYRIDENNLYQRQELFWLSQIWAILCMLVDAGILFHFRKALGRRELLVLASYIFLPVAAMALQIFVYGVAILYLATSLSILCMYMGNQVEQAKKYKERELELERSRTEIMLSQIQPHFLFNSLTSICYLCRTDPAQAERVVVNFSNYLRGNIESLNSINLIPFSKELAHLNHYLEIEKVRYGDKLKIVYDIQADGFMLPSLTVQPIVENAVRYGVGQKPSAGTIVIKTREYEKEFTITVTDDGVGFNSLQKPEDGRVHVGIHNVRQRLRQQIGGELQIESTPGKGTLATISIPKESTEQHRRSVFKPSRG